MVVASPSEAFTCAIVVAVALHRFGTAHHTVSGTQRASITIVALEKGEDVEALKSESGFEIYQHELLLA